MGKIRCACNDPKCKIGVYVGFEGDHYAMYMYGPNGEEIYMAIDPNAIVDMIRDLKKALAWYLEPEKEG